MSERIVTDGVFQGLFLPVLSDPGSVMCFNLNLYPLSPVNLVVDLRVESKIKSSKSKTSSNEGKDKSAP